MGEFTEQRFDYSAGREDAPELTIMVGISGSGKSTLVKQWINRGRGDIVRLNRDSLRAMLYIDVPWSNNLENLTRDVQKHAAILALQRGKDVIIDDCNHLRQVRQKWEEFAKENRAKFRIVTMTTDLDVCIKRDSKREGKEKVGEGVIRRQYKDLHALDRTSRKETAPAKLTRPYFERTEYLKNGGWVTRLPNAKWVLVDVDGTLANHVGVRGPYDESRVLEDSVWEPVAEMVRSLYPSHNVCVVSGRHDFCGDDTCDWLEMNAVPFDHILMRYSGDNRSDIVIKQELLDELSAVIGKESIAFVIDDRPRVCEMWRSNGLAVKQVFAGEVLENPTLKHADGCAYEKQTGYRRCPDCGALEYF